MVRPLDPQRLGDHLDRLYRAAWALTGSPQEAEDLVQETCARVLSRRRLLRNDDDLGYLLRALRNTFLLQLRAQRRRPSTTPLSEDLDLPEEGSGRDPETAAEASEVLRTIASLRDEFRDVVAAVDVAGLTYEDAARALRIPIGTVTSRLYRGRQQIGRGIEGR